MNRQQRSPIFFLGLFVSATIAVISPVKPLAANDSERFNKDVRKLTGDWESEPWHFGWLRLHQENFNEVADEFYLHLWGVERPQGLTALQVLERSFPISKVGDVDAKKDRIDERRGYDNQRHFGKSSRME